MPHPSPLTTVSATAHGGILARLSRYSGSVLDTFFIGAVECRRLSFCLDDEISASSLA
jgi:hypothetical protein